MSETRNRASIDRPAASRSALSALAAVSATADQAREALDALRSAEQARNAAIVRALQDHSVTDVAGAANLSDVQIYRITGRVSAH